MNRAEKAHAAMVEHKTNCAQTTLSVFDEMGLDKETPQKMALFFGGGMGTGSLCGAVTASYMIMGLRFSFDTDKPKENHEKIEAQIAKFNKRFISRHGSLLCKELVKAPEDHPKICPNLVKSAVEILEGRGDL
jgi:C_GCAxxG_C_C family probable redox protein